MTPPHPAQTLARFAANLTLDAIPAPVLRRAEELMLDWFACALAEACITRPDGVTGACVANPYPDAVRPDFAMF